MEGTEIQYVAPVEIYNWPKDTLKQIQKLCGIYLQTLQMVQE